MKTKFQTLTLQCRQSREVIDFSPQVTFFHGRISSGKSSVVRLIDFCLGGELEYTTALKLELVSASLSAQFGENEVLFERDANEKNSVRVTWRNLQSGETGAVNAPLQQSVDGRSIWSGAVYNFSDLIFYLLDVEPIKVRRNKTDPDAPLVRLSFRDMLWYCYLEQALTETDFFRMKDANRMPKSRDVMRFVMGFYTERMNELEIELDTITQQRQAKLQAAEQIRKFLKEFGFGTRQQVTEELTRANQALTTAQQEQARLRADNQQTAHITDTLRQQLRQAGEQLAEEIAVQAEIQQRIKEYDSLRAELISTKFKLARVKTASVVLAGAAFELCPACGTPIEKDSQLPPEVCELCHRTKVTSTDLKNSLTNATSRDLDARVEDLDEMLVRHQSALKQQTRRTEKLQQQKLDLDNRLQKELAQYDSAYLAQARDVERQIATYEERIRSLQELARMPDKVAEFEQDADQLAGREAQLKREIQNEKDSVKDAIGNVEELEVEFLQAIQAVKMPGVQPEDLVRVDKRSWMPMILAQGEHAVEWGFYNAGSGGKKVLFNICYALALHLVAARNKLPLPNFLIIDSPMKSIGKDVNQDIFAAFYRYLYGLAAGPLTETQFIIVDNEYVAPTISNINMAERFMTPDDPDHPPLISYYHGP